jgi:hypothetical protein
MTRAPRVVDELEEIAVARDDVDGADGLGGEGSDDVVGLMVRASHDRDAEGFELLADDRKLRLERIGDLLDIGSGRHHLGDTVRLVARDEIDAPLRAPVVVPARHDARGGVGGRELRDHVEQSARGVDRGAVGSTHRVGHPVEGAEVQRGSVEQHDPFLHGVLLRGVPAATRTE